MISRTAVHGLILAGAGLATYIVSLGLEEARSTSENVVVTVPARKSAADTPGPAGHVQTAAAFPTDRASLARELQRELQRVGCYDGDISGVWTTSTRMAMQAFIDRVNARLPIDAPDDVLLSLLRGHKDRACDAPCGPVGSAPSARCSSSTPPATTQRLEPSVPERPQSERSRDALAALATTAATAPLLPSPQEESGTAPRPREEIAPPGRPMRTLAAAPQTPVAAQMRDEPAPHRATQPIQPTSQPIGPIPPQGVYEGRRRRHVRRARSRPPKFLRAFVATVQKSLAPFGLH
jgi:hypothetical protein